MKITNKRGITLIALVVTIVVLLILAGISISMLTGENGVITQAKKSKDQTEIAEEKEAVQTAYTGAVGEKMGSEDITAEDVQKQLDINGTKATASGNIKVKFTKSGRTYTIKGSTISGPHEGTETGSKTLVQAFKDGEIQIGDYITNYNDTLNNPNATASLTTKETGFDGGTQTYKVNPNTTWRVVGLNEDETQLVITTGSPIKKEMESSATEEWKKDPYLYLDKAEGCYNTNDDLVSNNILDKVCAIYAGEYASETRSMRIEDINLALGLTLDKSANKLYKTNDESKNAITAYQGFWGQNYTYKINDYAPENYLKEKYGTEYSSLTNKKAGDKVAGSAYHYGYTSEVVDSSSKLYEVLFKGTENGSNGKSYWLASSGVYVYLDGSVSCFFGPGAVHVDRAGTGRALFGSRGYSYAEWLAVRPVLFKGTESSSNGKAYWLASSGAYANVGASDYCNFGPGAVDGGYAGTGYDLFSSVGNSNALWLAVRPVVYLQSEVTVDDLSISSIGSEEEWTTTLSYSHTERVEYGQIRE